MCSANLCLRPCVRDFECKRSADVKCHDVNMKWRRRSSIRKRRRRMLCNWARGWHTLANVNVNEWERKTKKNLLWMFEEILDGKVTNTIEPEWIFLLSGKFCFFLCLEESFYLEKMSFCDAHQEQNISRTFHLKLQSAVSLKALVATQTSCVDDQPIVMLALSMSLNWY